jgi:predicted dehydrogenase
VSGTWRQSLNLSGGGQLNDSGSHLIDIILWITGLKPDSIAAFSTNYGLEVDIDTALNVRFADGAQCNISVVGDAPGWWEDVTIVGSDGAFYVRNGELTLVKRGETHAITGLRDAGFADQNFIQSILGDEDVQVPPLCGLRVIQLTEAAWKSAAQGGKPVKVKN